MLEAKCKTFLVEMSFICMRRKIHFHINTFAFSIALKFIFRQGHNINIYVPQMLHRSKNKLF